MVVGALLAAAGLGVGNELTSGGARRGFLVGYGDHIVLAPYGIHAADPAAYAGDWFTREAPQPHWLFDLVVWAGRSVGQLPLALLIYYLLALAAFGAATALLAVRWCRPGWVAVSAAGAVGLLSSYQAIYLAGTNTLNSPLALPNVLGGNLAYLFLAAVLARRRWAPVVLPFVAAAHIQMGVLVLLAGALVWGYDAWRARARFGIVRGGLLRAALWWLAGAAVVLFGMRLRAVASNPAAFVEICNRFIPFHCAAATWGRWQVWSTIGAAVLALGVALRLAGRDRVRWLLAIGLPAAALVVAMYLDRRGVPVLGRLMQAYNAYRVGNLVFPFAVWGVLAPLLPFSTGAARGAAAWRVGSGLLSVLVAAPATVVFYTSPGTKTRFAEEFQFARPAGPALAALLVLGLAAWVGRTVGDRWRPGVGRVAAGVTIAGVAVGGLGIVRAGGYTGALPEPLQWPASSAEAIWGADAQAVIPSDVQVLISPNRPNFKLAMERGVVVDCKDLPYGGAPYREWTRRLDALGGTKQCESGSTATYDALDAATLDRAAREFGARAIVVTRPRDGATAQAKGLEALGYRRHELYGQAAGLDTDILIR